MLLDVRSLTPEQRQAAADRIRDAFDFALPDLEWFNSDPCERHTSIADGQAQIPPCRRCGINFRRHQRIGIAWLYLRGRGLIADQMGTGKTATAAGLMACAKQNGEFDSGRFVVVCKAAAVGQWMQEMHRFLPKVHVVCATGTRNQRIEKYVSGWEILVISQQMFINDAELLDRVPIRGLVVDDVDALRNPNNRTAYRLKRLGRECERIVVLTGTPLQKRLVELHSVLELLGGFDTFGSLTRFKSSYIREEMTRIYSPQAGRMINTRKTVGYKNLDDFIRKLRPFALRRTPADITDADLPAISPHTVWLDLHPAQRDRYAELRRGVLRIIREEGTSVRQATAVARFTYGQAICAGLSTLGDPDGPGTSVKLDWIEEKLVDGDLSEEKVVIFGRFTNTIESLQRRLDRHGIGHVTIWGREPDKTERLRRQNQFWDDPNCRILLGTEAIEQSLNLQVSRHLINIDQLINPARMQQMAGRIRRFGSAYRTVYVHNLLALGTQEEGILELLQREQALADHVWGESNDLFEALHPLALLELIGRPRSPLPVSR